MSFLFFFRFFSNRNAEVNNINPVFEAVQKPLNDEL